MRRLIQRRRRRHRPFPAHLLLTAALAASRILGLAAALTAHHHYVTGANGYVGRAIVHELLKSQRQESSSGSSLDAPQRNECSTIVCLVRRARVAAEQAYWQNQLQQLRSPGNTQTDTHDAPVTIHVRPYDMLDGGASFRAAWEEQQRSFTGTDSDPASVTTVHHVASVFGPTQDPVQTARDNVQGTIDLIHSLAACRNTSKGEHTVSSSVQLVLTSSMAAVRGTGQIPTNGRYYNKDDWNTLSTLSPDNWGSCYQWSKTESERLAWEHCRQHQIPMVSVCPSFVFGPSMIDGQIKESHGSSSSGSESFSMQLVKQWMKGESPVQSRLFVDVRDVAQAHAAAALHMKTVQNQRWIVSQEARIPSEVIAEWLQAVSRESGVYDPDKIHFDADFQGGAIPIGQKEVDAARTLQEHLGISLRPVKETIMEMARDIVEEDKSMH